MNRNYYTKLDNQLIDLKAEQSITLERFNPMFDFETVRGSKINDFIVPFSPINDRLFNWFGKHQSRFSNKKYLCEKYVDAILIEKGYIELSDVTEEGYQVFFTQNLSEVFGDYQHTTLNKIDFGEIAIPDSFNTYFDYLTDAYAMPSVVNRAFYGVNLKDGFNGIVNEFSNEAYTEGCPKVPMLSFKWLFDRIGALCDFRFEGEFFESEWYKRGLLENTFSLDNRSTILYQNHLPEMTIPTFLKELKKLLNLSLLFDVTNRVLVIKFTKTLLNQPTRLNFTEKVLPSSSRRPQIANRLELDWDLDKDDNLMKVPPSDFNKYQAFDYAQGTGQGVSTQGVSTRGVSTRGTFFSVKTAFSTRMTDPLTGLAMAEQVGISPLFNQLNSKNTPKILLWNGIVNGIPSATNAHGDLKLAWSGDNNLVESCWKDYESWRSRTASRTVQANLTAADLAILDFHRRAGAEVAIHVHGRDYYIESLRVNMPLNGYTTLELWEK